MIKRLFLQNLFEVAVQASECWVLNKKKEIAGESHRNENVKQRKYGVTKWDGTANIHKRSFIIKTDIAEKIRETRLSQFRRVERINNDEITTKTNSATRVYVGSRWQVKEEVHIQFNKSNLSKLFFC